jgi:hypothetical protein
VRLALLVLCGCDHLLQLDDIHVLDAAPDPERGLVAYYPLEDIGTDPKACAHDAAGNGHDGACATGMPTLVRGKLGQAFAFDGNSVVTVAYASDLNSGSGTVAFWYQLPAGSMGGCAVNRQYGEPMGSGNSWQVCIDLSGASIYFGASVRSIRVDMLPITDTVWHHIAMSWTASRTGGWLDGIPIFTLNGGVAEDTYGLSFGSDLDSGVLTAPMVGNLDEIRIYDRVLSDTEVGALAAM